MSPRAMGGWLALVPGTVLFLAYLWLAVDHGTPRLLDVVVHESGRYTLGETMLYARHFLRELPIAAVYAAAAVASAAAWGPRPTTAPPPAMRAAALGGAVALVAGAWSATVSGWGAPLAWTELLQGYVRDDEAPVLGAHWHYHLLSTIAYVAACIVVAAALRWVVDGTTSVRGSRVAIAGVLATVAVLTLVCGPTALPFVEPRHLGHQAREIATHGVVTLPLSFAVLSAVGRWQPAARPATRNGGAAIALLVGAITLAWLGGGVLLTDAMDGARPGASLSSLVAAHVYEHLLDYLFVALLVAAFAPGVPRHHTEAAA